MDRKGIANMVATCLILHNMCVSDRVMGTVAKDYVPSSRVAEKETGGDVVDSETVDQSRNRNQNRRTVATSIANFAPDLATTIAERQEWKSLKDPDEWARL